MNLKIHFNFFKIKAEKKFLNFFIRKFMIIFLTNFLIFL